MKRHRGYRIAVLLLAVCTFILLTRQSLGAGTSQSLPAVQAKARMPVLPTARRATTPQQQASASKVVYLDRDFRFSFRVPDGWIVRTHATAVTASRRHGPGYTNIAVMDACGSPQDMLAQTTQRVPEQWTRLQEITDGDMTLGARPAAFGLYSVVTHKGIPSFLKIVTAVAGGQAFVLITVAPQKEFMQLKAGVDEIEKTFVIGGGQGADGK